jgi:hypothetical protein
MMVACIEMNHELVICGIGLAIFDWVFHLSINSHPS